MKKLIQKISAALQVVLLAPIKLPVKALHILKYITLGLGVVETVLEDKDKKGEGVDPPDEGDKVGNASQYSEFDLDDDPAGKVLDDSINRTVLLNSDLNKGEEVRDETE